MFLLLYAKGNIIQCNVATNTGRGFDFVGTQAQTQWVGNSMENNLKGMALGGIIDMQGSAPEPGKNVWLSEHALIERTPEIQGRHTGFKLK